MKRKHIFVLVFLSLVAVKSSTGQASLDKGLVAYYPFNNSAKDESGNNNNPSGYKVTYTADRNGKANAACRFNGKNNYIQIPDSKSLHFGTALTFSAWVKVDGFYRGKCHGNRIFMKGGSDYQSGNLFINYDDNHFTNGSNCDGGKPDEAHELFYAPHTRPVKGKYIIPGKWYLLTLVYDGTTVTLYSNCDIIASGTVKNYAFTNYDDLLIGRMEDDQYPYWFNGVLDDVRFYNRALNKDEIKLLCDLPQAPAPAVNPCTGDAKPSAKFDYTITDCNTVNFRLLTNNPSNIKAVKWLFGDGKTSTEKKPSHIYSRFGEFKVKAIVTNKQGCSDTVTKEIKLAGLNTDFVISEPGEPGVVQFKAKNNKASYTWDFADGNTTSNETVVAHTFSSSGTYAVRMFAKNLTGCTDTVLKNIAIRLPKQEVAEQDVVISMAPSLFTPTATAMPGVSLEKRQKDLVRTIQVNSDTLYISLYDNGIVDGDSITLLYNNQVLAEKQVLNEKALRFTIRVDKNNPSNELVMYANNVGSIPPNTALMIVYDGEERHSLIISSTNKTNGAVAFTRRQ